MAKSKNVDTDFDEMTEAQLGEFINEQNNNLDQEVVAEEPKASETTEEVNETQETEQLEQTQETAQETEEEDEITDPLYRGKSQKELVEMIKNQNSMISRQGNEKHEIMKRLEALETSKPDPKVEEENFYYVDESGNKINYNQQDLDVIDKIVDQKFKVRQEQRKQETAQQIQQNKQSNEMFWSTLEVANPNLKKQVEGQVLDAIKKDPKATLEKKDWLKDYILSYKPGGNTKIDNRKKLKAVTASSGKAPARARKATSDMTADEYLADFESKHGSIPRQAF